MHNTLAIAALVVGSLTASIAVADTTVYNRVSLQAEAGTQIPHDLMHVTLYVEERSNDAASLAQSITQTLNQAIAESKSAPDVTVSMGNRNSSPVYDDKGKKIITWRERAELRLESTHFAQLSTLTGSLLQNMNMGSMRFSIAESTQQSHENQLMEQAIGAFKERAQVAVRALGGKDYKLVNLNLSSQGGYQPPMYSRAVMMSAPAADAVTPEIEGGSSQLKLVANGEIEIIH